MSYVADAQQVLVSSYIGRSGTALFLFDYVITLSQEVNAIWGRTWTATTWLYMFTRYSTIIAQIVFVIRVWNFVSCAVTMRINNALLLVQYVCLAWFSTLRVYALLDGKYLVAGIVLLLNLVPFAVNTFNYITSIVYDSPQVCTELEGGSAGLHLSLSLFTRTAVIIGDVLVLAVTWTKTVQSYREARDLNIRAPLATTLFRDGTFYFVLLFIFNVLNVAETNVPVLLTLQVVEPFLAILPPFIVCRFILSLRQIDFVGGSWISESQPHSLRFVGNIGQSLQFAEGSEDGQEEDVPEMEASSNISPEIVVGAAEDDGDYLRYNYDQEPEV